MNLFPFLPLKSDKRSGKKSDDKGAKICYDLTHKGCRFIKGYRFLTTFGGKNSTKIYLEKRVFYAFSKNFVGLCDKIHKFI
jgi:hypothetical protein